MHANHPWNVGNPTLHTQESLNLTTGHCAEKFLSRDFYVLDDPSTAGV